MKFNQWLDVFVEEKGLDPYHVFTIHTNDFWQTHIISLEIVLDALKAAPADVQEWMKHGLVMADLTNQPVLPFFEVLAKRLIENRS